MAGWTLRLTDLLGTAPGEIAEEDLQRLIDNGVREDADLDFKQARYGSTDQAKREFAADVAAMANDRGGLIIIGLRDENDVAVERTPVQLEEGEEARLRQTAAANLAPHVPFDVHVVHSDQDGLGYYLLVIPPSPLRPHAVRRENDLRYPRRDGTTKRWLSEAEVANTYRDRFRAMDTQVSTVEQILGEGLSQMDRAEEAFVAIAIVPAAPGSISINLEQVQSLQQWAQQFQPTVYWRGFFPSQPLVGVGPRRFRVATIYDRTTPPSWAYAELHVDGAGFAAQRLVDPRPNRELDDIWVLNSGLVFALAQCLRLLGRHAVENVGASGDVLIQARVLGRSMRLAYLHHMGAMSLPEAVESGLTLSGARAHQTLVLEELGGGAQALLGAARLVATDLFNAFGSPEVRFVAPDGALRIRYFGSYERPELERLADQDNIDITAEEAPGE